MADLPAGAIEQMDAAREAAEVKLKRALDPLQESENPLDCAPVFAEEWARPLFRAAAAKLLTNAGAAERFSAQLDVLIAHIVETIMPDAGLDIARAFGTEDARPPNLIRDIATGTLWERSADGVVERLASDPAYDEHGVWEHFAPPGVKFFVRRSLFPEANAAARAVLESALRAEKTYWMERFYERFHDQEAASRSDSQPPVNAEPSAPSPKESRFAAAAPEAVKRYPRRAAWLDNQLRIRKWTKHTLQSFGGPNRASTQKILDSLPVRDVVLERVAEALSAAPPTQSLKDPRVESDNIPQD
jgi:hypothetical protein